VRASFGIWDFKLWDFRKIVVYATNCKNRRFCGIAKYKMKKMAEQYPLQIMPTKACTDEGSEVSRLSLT
jgi:hypothetical protein